MHSAPAIHKHLQKARKIVIVPHKDPDGDALGAAAAFHEYLSAMGKNVIVFCATEPNHKYQFIHRDIPIQTDPEIFKNREVDTIVTLDSGDLRYNGIADHVAGHRATIINIDHHATNEYFGHLNLVMPSAASTTEILFKYFRLNGVRISQKMATSLLTGLSNDTGNFTNAATSGEALRAGGELILSGGNFNLVTSSTLKNKSIGALRLWGKAFSRLTRDERLGLTHTYITRADLRELGVGEAEYEGISNFLNNLENTDMTLLLTELPDGQVKGSLRTTKNNVDVSAIAKKFGGGGHKKAAGFSADGTIQEVLGKILTN